MWRLDELAIEARRNFGPPHAVLGALAALVVAALMSFVMLQGDRALSQEAARRAAGSLVWTATAGDSRAPLDGTSCAHLAAWPGVIAAGGQSSATLPDLYSFGGGRPLPVVGLTPGAVQVFSPSTPWATVTVGSELAVLGEVGAGTWLLDADGARVAQVSAVVQEAPISALMSAVAVPVPPDSPLEICWVRLHPSAVSLGGELLTAAFPGGRATIAPFLRDQSGTVTPVGHWEHAISMHPWLLGGAVVLGATLLGLWSRRAELAVYRTFGTSRLLIAVLVGLETALVLLPAFAVGISVGGMVFALASRSGASPDLVRVAASQAFAALVTCLSSAILAAPIFASGRITETLRDR